MADTFKGIITADGKKRQLPYGNVLGTPVSDKTLSIPGAFADSKIVGDKFAKADSETASLKEDLTKETAEQKLVLAELDKNGYINLIKDLRNTYSIDSVANVTSETITLNGSEWSGGVKYKMDVTPNTDYLITFSISGSGVSVITLYDSNETKISDTPISYGNNDSCEFNSGKNSEIIIWFRIGAIACNDFVYSNLTFALKENALKKIEQRFSNFESIEYTNLIDCSKPLSKTDEIIVDKNTVILNGSSWVGQVTYKVNVAKNADYVLHYKISREAGVAGISIGSAESTSDIVTNVDNIYRSALTFNTGNNSVVYIKFKIRNTDCVNYTYNNISLVRIGDFKDTFIKKNGMKNTICCWGDSLTAGAGANKAININGLAGATMPKALAHLLGYAIPNEADAFDGNEDKAVINFGVGGETSRTILCRMGAMQMVVDNITIPSSGSVSFSEIRCTDGERVYPLHQNWSGSKWVFDTCYISGIEGTLTYTGPQVETETEKGIYTFSRKDSGTIVVIDRPTAIVSPIHKRYGDILILQIGHNGGWDNNYDTLVNQYRMAIEKAQTDRYIIIGMTSGNAESNREWEYALQTAFQRHYINMREYLAHPIYNESGEIVNCYGLADRGFTPTADDLEKIAVGEVPLQLKVDSAHFTSYGYYTEAEQVYKRGKELGYWN